GLARAAEVEDGIVVRMPKAYPIYDETYAAAVAEMRAHLARLENLQLVGRNGMHKYNNQDHSMYTAMLAVKNILGGRFDVWGVNVEQAYQEELTEEEALRASQPLVPV